MNVKQIDEICAVYGDQGLNAWEMRKTYETPLSCVDGDQLDTLQVNMLNYS